MMKKLFALSVLAVFGLMISGCHTLHKAGKGAAEGFPEDVKDSCKGVKGADAWVKKNLW